MSEGTNDTTRVVDDPAPDYFRPLRQKAADSPAAAQSEQASSPTCKEDLPVGEEPLPPPVSAQEGERGYWYHILPGNGEWELWHDHVNGSALKVGSVDGNLFSERDAQGIAAYLNGTSDLHTTIREQAAEIERLKNANHGKRQWIDRLARTLNATPEGDPASYEGPYVAQEVIRAAESLRSELQQAKEEAERRRKAMQHKLTFPGGHEVSLCNCDSCVNFRSLAGRPSKGDPDTSQPAPAAASEGSKAHDPFTTIGPRRKTLDQLAVEALQQASDAGLTMPEPAPAPAAESPWSVVSVSMGDDTIPALRLRDRFPDRDMLHAAADWLDRRTATESRLSALQQQAEAWNSMSPGWVVDIVVTAIGGLRPSQEGFRRTAIEAVKQHFIEAELLSAQLEQAGKEGA